MDEREIARAEIDHSRERMKDIAIELVNRAKPAYVKQKAKEAAVHKTVEKGSVRVTVRNPEKSLAFMVHLRLTRGKGGDDVVPIFWNDNYVSLLPGESRELTARYDASALEGKEPELEVDGWNVAP